MPVYTNALTRRMVDEHINVENACTCIISYTLLSALPHRMLQLGNSTLCSFGSQFRFSKQRPRQLNPSPVPAEFNDFEQTKRLGCWDMQLHLLNLCLVAGNIHYLRLKSCRCDTVLLGEKLPTFRILLELLDPHEEGTVFLR